MRSNLMDLSLDFHTYTLAWTPQKMTFFVDGRELYTITDDFLHISSATNFLRINLGIYDNAVDNEYKMYVDYVRMYKPINGDYTSLYKSTYDGMNHNLMAEANIPWSKVHHMAGSIIVNPLNGNEIFYTDEYQRIQCYKVSGSSRTIVRLEYNDGATTSNANVASNLVYLPMHNILVYKGTDNRIQYFGRSSTEPCGWYHWYIDDNWSSPSNLANSTYSKICVSSSGIIYYIGTDNLIHKFSWNGADWIGSIVSPFNAAYPVKGDFSYDEASNTFIYVGTDDKIHILYYAGGAYQRYDIGQHIAPQITAANRPGILLPTNNGNDIYFVGQDDKLHLLKNNNGPCSYSLVPYQYDNAGYPQADRFLNSIAWLSGQNRVVYVGKDGRIQVLEKVNGTWSHFWIDDYWNTDDFMCENDINYRFPYPFPYYAVFNSYPQYYTMQKNPSLFIDNNGIIYYRGKDGHIRNLKWEPCELRNPGERTLTSLHRKIIKDSSVNTKKDDMYIMVDSNRPMLELFPNPAKDFIDINTHSLETFNYKILSLYGTCMASGRFRKENRIDLSALPKGLYYLSLFGDKTQHQLKFVKE